VDRSVSPQLLKAECSACSACGRSLSDTNAAECPFCGFAHAELAGSPFLREAVKALRANPFIDNGRQLHTDNPPSAGFYEVLFFDECEDADDPDRPTRAGLRGASWDGSRWLHDDQRPVEEHGMQVFGWYRTLD
jgi:hypothetical protein